MVRSLIIGSVLVVGAGLVACSDDDSSGNNNNQPLVEICANGMDDDGDGLVDCLDADCLNNPACQSQTETLCADGVDNDNDGQTDCGDTDCANAANCLPETACNDGQDNDSDGQTDCDDTDCANATNCQTQTETLCNDDLDNDNDGQTDCDDTDCATAANCLPETACNDGQDNDSDGDVDCADSDCASQTYCETPEATCDDGFDNDGDGDVDCADSDCASAANCLPETACNDGLDNDSDGDVDCADSDCASQTYCETPEATCDDGFDNDGDGAVDCSDSDCLGTTACTSIPESSCNDGLDNDSDGAVDCADSDCASQTYCETPEATCNDGFDNDGDGAVDCADSDCASQTYCEATEATCDDSFDNDGDGQVDCADSDCAAAPACQPTGVIGASCLVDGDCTDPSALCLEEYGVGLPGGYCTVLGCDGSTVLCPTGSSCVTVAAGLNMCLADCTLGGTDCRDAYSCDDVGGSGVCFAACTLHTQCTETDECDSASGFCVWGVIEATNPAVSGDANANGLADPGETFDLGFDAQNAGGGVASGPITVAVAVNGTTTTVTGTVTLTAPGNTTCSAGNLAAGASAPCPAWGVQIPGSAQTGERLDLDVTFTNGTETWNDVITLTIGSNFVSLLAGPDPQGDSGTFTCDLADLQGYVSGGTMHLRMVFHAACTIDGLYDVWLCDNVDCLTLTLEDVAGTMTPTLWQYNGGSWQSLTAPASYQVSPTTGSSATLDYQIAVTDIPVLNLAGQSLDTWAAIAGPSATDYDDEAPDATTGTITW